MRLTSEAAPILKRLCLTTTSSRRAGQQHREPEPAGLPAPRGELRGGSPRLDKGASDKELMGVSPGVVLDWETPARLTATTSLRRRSDLMSENRIRFKLDANAATTSSSPRPSTATADPRPGPFPHEASHDLHQQQHAPSFPRRGVPQHADRRTCSHRRAHIDVTRTSRTRASRVPVQISRTSAKRSASLIMREMPAAIPSSWASAWTRSSRTTRPSRRSTTPTTPTRTTAASSYPNVNTMKEMADLVTAVRSYEANLSVQETFDMADRALRLAE